LSTPINPKYALFVYFLESNRKYLKTRKLALFLWSVVQALHLNSDRKSKGKESYRVSAVIYTYSSKSWVVALKRPSGSSVKWLLQSDLEKKKTKQQCETVYSTHSQRPDWSERAVHYTQYTWGLSMHGIRSNANQKPDCSSVMPYNITIFFTPPSKKDYYNVLHTG